MRHGDQVVAVLTHQTALADRRKASPLERAYLDCARDLLHMLSEGTFPNVGDLAMSRSSPRVGDGFIRLDVDGGVAFASPNAISAYHRMGLAAELEGHNLVTVTRPLISDPFEAQELANHVRDSLAGGSSMRMEVDAGGAAVLLRTLPLVVARDGGGRGGADPRRHRGEAPRPRAAVQGRDHPRDPPPGEEQPADGGRAAAAAGAPHQQRRGPRGADRIGAAGVVHRPGARRAVDVGGRGGQPRRGRRPDPADHERRRVGRHPDPDRAGRRPGRARRRPGHRPGHGDHRAGPERDRARLRRSTTGRGA